MDFPLDPVSSLAIYDGAPDATAHGSAAREEGECSRVGSADPDQSVMGIVQALAGAGAERCGAEADSAHTKKRVNSGSCPGSTFSESILLCEGELFRDTPIGGSWTAFFAILSSFELGHFTMAPTTAGQVICKSQGGVYVPSQPRNPPDPTQGFLVCDPIREFTHDNLRLVLLQIVEWDPGIIHCTSLDNRNLDETYEVKSIGWYVSHSTDFPSTDNTFDSNYASYENGMSVGIEQEAEYETRLQFLSDSAQCQHIARVVRSLIGRFKQLETLQRACSRYSIPFSCSVLIGNFPACAFLSAASFNAGCFRRHVMNSVSLPLPWDPGILLGIFYGHLFGTRNSGTVLQYCNKFKFNDYHLAWCSGSSTTMFCLYFQWMLSSGFSVEKLCVPRVICRVQFLSTLESSHFMTLEHHLTYCLRHDQTNELHKYYIDAHRDKMSFVTFPTASMKCHDPISATWCFSACVVFSMINQLWHWHSACWRYPCLIELKQQLHHGVIYTTHGYGGPNFSCNVGEGHMETSYPFAANYRICFRYRTGGRLNQPSAENVGAQYNKHTGEDIVRALGHEQKTTELLVIRDLVLSVQGLQGFDLLIVREPQAMYMIAPMPLVTYVEVLDAHVQWDPGGFLSTMSGEHELNHTERSRRLHEIGARGYKMIIGMNNLSTPWDLGIVKIYEPAVRVHVKARRLYCESESYKLLLPAHAIAWGQAMFCRGGSVTPVVLPGLHLSDRSLMWARPNRSSLGEKDKETGGQHDSAWKKWVRIGKAPPDRTPCPTRTSALEQTIRGYTEKLGDDVIDPCLGTVFDSLGEAYDF